MDYSKMTIFTAAVAPEQIRFLVELHHLRAIDHLTLRRWSQVKPDFRAQHPSHRLKCKTCETMSSADRAGRNVLGQEKS